MIAHGTARHSVCLKCVAGIHGMAQYFYKRSGPLASKQPVKRYARTGLSSKESAWSMIVPV